VRRFRCKGRLLKGTSTFSEGLYKLCPVKRPQPLCILVQEHTCLKVGIGFSVDTRKERLMNAPCVHAKSRSRRDVWLLVVYAVDTAVHNIRVSEGSLTVRKAT
jgi:hypothetical protein